MDYLTMGLYLAVFLQIWVTISLFKQLTEHINDLMSELVEDLPPALGEAMSGSMGELQGMAEVNPIQMAIAQLIPNLVQPTPNPKITPQKEKDLLNNERPFQLRIREHPEPRDLQD
jgi:hypothetical protein